MLQLYLHVWFYFRPPALPTAVVDRAAALLRTPGISIVQAALTAVSAGPVHAMHDPTEGGVLNGLAELAAAASVGLEVEVARSMLHRLYAEAAATEFRW